jgi:hypothetical protein
MPRGLRWRTANPPKNGLMFTQRRPESIAAGERAQQVMEGAAGGGPRIGRFLLGASAQNARAVRQTARITEKTTTGKTTRAGRQARGASNTNSKERNSKNRRGR